ncbi:MAG: hypothetical protein IJH50_13550 [Kiritimatiellae bacterium]|nr:hypothetical protein [Kiritimatiellia bacterium]
MIAGLAIAVCAFHVSAVTLENPEMQLHFADAAHGFAIGGIVNNKAGGARFVSGSADSDCGGFWSLGFRWRTDAGTTETIRVNNLAPCADKRVVDGENEKVFVWEGLDLPGEKGVADVRARVKLAGAAAEWTLSIENRSTNWVPVETWYPVLAKVLRPGVDDVLIPTMNLGAKFVPNCDPVKLRLRGFGSPAWFPMVTAIQQGRAGLYVAAHDGEMLIKSLIYLPDGTLQFQTPLANADVPGRDARGPGFKVVTQCYDGDWWDAARIYRAWALNQKWAAKGPIAKRTDYPKALAEVAVWGRSVAADGTFHKLFRAAFPDMKIGLRWYCWENEGFDTCYPDLTPRPKIKELFRDACERGILVMPYVNGRLWDRALPSFPSVEADACHDENGNVRAEKYTAEFAVMCPTAPRWQKKLFDIGAEVVDGLGANAIYYDQVNCAQWRTCYSRGHSHPAGGGAWWTSGYREAFTPIKEKFAAAGVPITSEGPCEAWMDLIDGALIVGRAPEATDVPFYPAVYSGYTTYFCIEQEADDSPEAMFACQVRYALWGCTTGTWNDHRLFHPDPAKRSLAAQADVIRRIARLRESSLDYLAYGHLEDEFRPIDPPPTVTYAHHPTRGTKKTPLNMVEYPAVLGAVWRDVGGTRRATFVANVSDSQQAVRFRLSHKDGRIQTRHIGNEPVPEYVVSNDVCSVTLDPQSLVCFEEEFH